MDKSNPFQVSVKTNYSQIIIIILTVISVLLIPLVVLYVLNPNKKSVKEIITDTFSFEINNETVPEMINIPVINKEVDISVIKQNPDLLKYIGLFLIMISVIIWIVIARRLLKE